MRVGSRSGEGFKTKCQPIFKTQGMIEAGYKAPTKLDGEKIVPKPRSELDEKDFNMANSNSKAISCIINGLTCNKILQSHEYYLCQGNMGLP